MSTEVQTINLNMIESSDLLKAMSVMTRHSTWRVKSFHSLLGPSQSQGPGTEVMKPKIFLTQRCQIIK